MDKQAMLNWLEGQEGMLSEMARAIWEKPELAMEEVFASGLQRDALAAAGFQVREVPGVPTAFAAEYGHGKPVLGILGEYDALPDLSQQQGPERRALVEHGPGHGCGHNLLGTAGLGAAMALAKAIESGALAGTVRYYGCPAEETISGKTLMAKAHVFDDLDACVTWHPSSYTAPWANSMLANLSVRFRFKGVPAHAASAAELGRSALDAVELMNVGANYLREHVNEKVRMHYVTTNGGSVPNTVPEDAEVWYMVRAPKFAMVRDTFRRLKGIARGAAQMTETELAEVRLESAAWEVLTNEVICGVIDRNMKAMGGPGFAEEDRGFAAEMVKTFGPGEQVKGFAPFFVPAELEGQGLFEGVADPVGRGVCIMASSDVGDVSWITPLCQFGAAVWPLGIPTHTWRTTASTSSHLAMRGMLFAAKTMAATLYDLCADPALLKEAQTEFSRATEKQKYVCALDEEI